MRHKSILFTAAVVGATAASAGLLGMFGPLGNADATSSGGVPPPADVAGLLDDMAPGAVVSKQADGSVSVSGVLTESAQADIRRTKELAALSPTVIRCDGSGATLTCHPVPDSEVNEAAKADDARLYNRMVYRSITKEVTDQAAPFFDPDELVCDAGDLETNETFSCNRVDRVQPIIPLGETVFTTYAPYVVTFDERGLPTLHVTGTPEVKLARAAP